MAASLSKSLACNGQAMPLNRARGGTESADETPFVSRSKLGARPLRSTFLGYRFWYERNMPLKYFSTRTPSLDSGISAKQ